MLLSGSRPLDEDAIAADRQRAIAGAQVGRRPQQRRTRRGPLPEERGLLRQARAIRPAPLRPVAV